MITRISTLLLLPLLCLTASAGNEGIIRFVNGDQLSGTPTSLDPKSILWNSMLMERPVAFPCHKVLDVTLPSAPPAGPSADHEAVITLTKKNKGGVIRGQLSEVTEDAVVINTWFSGPLRFKRSMVESVHIEAASAARYRGPSGIDDWKITPQGDTWTYSNSSFVSKGSGSIARDDLLSDECSVSFDAEWPSDAASFKVVLFSDSADTKEPKSGYDFSIQRGGMILRNLRSQTYIGNSNTQEIAQSNRARFEIKASRRTGKIAWFVNDKLVDMWTDNEAGRGQFGNALHFITHRNTPLRISRIRIADWDGEIAEPMAPRMGMRRMNMGFGMNDMPPQPPKEENLEGRMKLANGDSIDGKVKSIQNGKVTIDTSLGELTLPVARLRTIMLPKADKEEAIARNGDVRVWMPDGAFLVFDFIDSDKDTITGQSQAFGTATFRRAAFQKIEFDIHNFDLDSLRKEAVW